MSNPHEPFSFGVIYGPDPRTTTERVAFTVSTRDGDLKFQVKRAYTLPTLQTAKQRCDWPVMKQRWNHLADLDLPLIDSSRITVLLGGDIRGVHDVLEQRKSPDGIEAPNVYRGYFGWYVRGPIPMDIVQRPIKEPPGIFFVHHDPREDELRQSVAKLWEMEVSGVGSATKPLSPDEKRSVALLNLTTRHTGSQYEMGLLWRYDDVKLPDNTQSALAQLRSLERRFKCNPKFAEMYDMLVKKDDSQRLRYTSGLIFSSSTQSHLEASPSWCYTSRQTWKVAGSV